VTTVGAQAASSPTSGAWPSLCHLLRCNGLQEHQPTEVQLCVLPFKAALAPDDEAVILAQQSTTEKQKRCRDN